MHRKTISDFQTGLNGTERDICIDRLLCGLTAYATSHTVFEIRCGAPAVYLSKLPFSLRQITREQNKQKHYFAPATLTLTDDLEIRR